MKVLLVTDTHGRLSCIDDLMKRTETEAVIHAGDLGFCDDGWLPT